MDDLWFACPNHDVGVNQTGLGTIYRHHVECSLKMLPPLLVGLYD